VFDKVKTVVGYLHPDKTGTLIEEKFSILIMKMETLL